MKINQEGIDLIKRFEGCRLVSYPDPGTGGKPWTIGWGSTGYDVKEGLIWTQEQADSRLLSDLDILAVRMSKLISPALADNEFAALMSLAYNIGVGNFASSTLLKMINKGDVEEAAEEFVKWNKSAGKVMDGLTLRRKAEKVLYLS